MEEKPGITAKLLAHSARIAALRYLRTQQKENGLWPYLPDRDGAIEPASWSAIACRQETACTDRFMTGLFSLQNPDGGWSSEMSRQDSDWSTAAALMGLRFVKPALAPNNARGRFKIDSACDRADKWIMDSRTERYSNAAKFALLVWKGPTYDYERGWSWTQNTFDWVEPTAYVLLSLKNSEFARQARVSQVIQLAEEFLLSLVCKEGGWNFGDRSPLAASNPADVQSTVMALLALETRKQEAKVKKSLAWLLERKSHMESVSEISWTALALSSYRLETADIFSKLLSLQAKNGSFSSNLLTQAVACIALEPGGTPFSSAIS